MLPIDSKLFQIKSDRSSGFIFYSGSDATFLVEDAYKVLKNHVINYFGQNYGLYPNTGRKILYDICYLNVPSNYVKPTIMYHFEGGANFEVGVG